MSRTLPLCRNKVAAPDCILWAGKAPKGTEAVHAINQLESGAEVVRKGREGALILLVPSNRERVKGQDTMVLGGADPL